LFSFLILHGVLLLLPLLAAVLVVLDTGSKAKEDAASWTTTTQAIQT
jgi:hypothetical protein